MNYVKNAWYVASWAQDLLPEKPYGTFILNEPVVVWRNADGELAAMEDRCVHRLAPLSLGRCEGDKLRCMYHGLLFDRTGAVVEIPGQDLIPAQARVRSYPVAEKHSWVWIWMGDHEAADEVLIPGAVGLDHPDYILGHGQLDYAAEARLINDNLLDFSHLSYVHANSFGAPEAWAYERPKITMLERGVRVERWITGESAVPGEAIGQPIERFASYDFLVPGVLLMTGGNFPQGTSQSLGGGAPDMSKALAGVTFTSQAVTPMTDKTARYFFSWGPHRDHGDEALRDTLMGIAAMAFGEDKDIIEAQQRVMDATPDFRIMPTTADRGVTLFNRLVEKLARDERTRLSVAS
ncbi:aromatic ring-hydroxylating dioxygenase subunit alpha [Sphingobium sp.]|uniref:aromatic ring-hydroxylating dioxygenase subunit alpha n=1 Tax=Sphingobium TaxID=165695 RepID=UPI001A246C4A|nr:aromatic ring-hydroxylating dioxygenase subunit alpha [Sphingobium sp.]MBJ7375891.1 aromatic ring-hydroxylating dioxygenase subunit alpha [Sphingobium sp.]